MLSSHRAASVPTCAFYKTRCLVAQHMAQEFVVLFKKNSYSYSAASAWQEATQSCSLSQFLSDKQR